MNEKLLTDAMGALDDRYVTEALRYNRKKRTAVRVKWGAAAACVCLLVGLLVWLPGQFSGTVGGELVGTYPDGIDPFSFAVYPVTEKLEDVEDATKENLTEAEAYALETLSAYLPDSLPDGICYEAGSLYETTMKDGTKYRRLRVQYAVPEEEPQNVVVDEWGNEIDGVSIEGGFLICVYDYRPGSSHEFYAPEEVTEELIESLDKIGEDSVFDSVYIDFGGIYVLIEGTGASADEILMVVDTIRQNVS